VASGERLKKRVGRSVAKKPETLNVEEVLEEVPEPVVAGDMKPYKDSMGMTVDPVEEAAAKNSRAQENEWDKIKVRYAVETRNIIMSEFIREKGLFLELAKFAKRKLR
jgi:hypothetical protein